VSVKEADRVLPATSGERAATRERRSVVKSSRVKQYEPAVIGALSVLAALTAWQLVANARIWPPLFLPGPWEVGQAMVKLLPPALHPTIPPTLQFLSKVPVEWGGANPPYFYYFHYYAIQAFYQAGGKEWNDWHPRVRELLLKHQNADGSWDVPAGSSEAQYSNGDKVYSTAMATLILDIYRHYLPAYQR